jgi:hypothetical protein
MIEEMATGERERLFAALKCRPSLTAGYALVPLEILDLLLRSHNELARFASELGRTLLPYADEAARYKHAAEAKKQRTTSLFEAIRQLVKTGTPRKPTDILKALSKRDDAEALVYRMRKGERKLLSKKTIANLLCKIE